MVPLGDNTLPYTDLVLVVCMTATKSAGQGAEAISYCYVVYRRFVTMRD